MSIWDMLDELERKANQALIDAKRDHDALVEQWRQVKLGVAQLRAAATALPGNKLRVMEGDNKYGE